MKLRTIMLALLGLERITSTFALESNNTVNANSSEDFSDNSTEGLGLAPVNNKLLTAASQQPGLNLTSKQKQQIINLINTYRRTVNPSSANEQQVSWDYNLEAAIDAFVAQNGINWFFETGLFPGPKGNYKSYNGFYLMQMPEFSHFVGYDFVIHDTTQSKLKNGVESVIAFRCRQGNNCIDYYLCSANTYSDHESCGHPLVLAPQKPCSWATQYYPNLMDATLSTFACKTIEVHGPNAPREQDMSFWCYGKRKNATNDVYYQKGASCSACPEEAPRCVKKLCAPQI